MGEGLSIARAATNELDAAKFDPLLIKSVAKNVQTSLDMLLSRLDPLVGRFVILHIAVVSSAIRVDCARQVGYKPSGASQHSSANSKCTSCNLSVSLCNKT